MKIKVKVKTATSPDDWSGWIVLATAGTYNTMRYIINGGVNQYTVINPFAVIPTSEATASSFEDAMKIAVDSAKPDDC